MRYTMTHARLAFELLAKRLGKKIAASQSPVDRLAHAIAASAAAHVAHFDKQKRGWPVGTWTLERCAYPSGVRVVEFVAGSNGKTHGTCEHHPLGAVPLTFAEFTQRAHFALDVLRIESASANEGALAAVKATRKTRPKAMGAWNQTKKRARS